MGFAVKSYYLKARDAELFTVVCLPEEEGKYPVILYRSPYGGALEHASDAEAAESILEGSTKWLERGYAVVHQHCCGTGKSTGDFIPYINDREDGLALQAWVREQPFYNGEILLCGSSYLSSVHYVTAPFADDIKGAVFEVQDCERYNVQYRNGFFKIGLHGKHYMLYYKKKGIERSYHPDAFNALPVTDVCKAVLGEEPEDFLETLHHPDRNDAHWQTRCGGIEAHEAVKHARIPILLTTHFYDIYTGGVFDMWNTMDEETRRQSALAVSPYDHSGRLNTQPVEFPQGMISEGFGEDFRIDWCDYARGKRPAPIETGKVSYYRLFENRWCTEEFGNGEKEMHIPLGEGEITYTYNPVAPATFKGGLSAAFEGTAWQDEPNSRYDIKSFISDEFEQDTMIKGKMQAKLCVKSDCEDTCFYMRISLVKEEGAYGLRDDIHALSEFAPDYIPGDEVEMKFSFDEHAFMVKKGERIRIDVSSSAHPHYVRHTNIKGLYCEQTSVKVAHNTIVCGKSALTLFAE